MVEAHGACHSVNQIRAESETRLLAGIVAKLCKFKCQIDGRFWLICSSWNFKAQPAFELNWNNIENSINSARLHSFKSIFHTLISMVRVCHFFCSSHGNTVGLSWKLRVWCKMLLTEGHWAKPCFKCHVTTMDTLWTVAGCWFVITHWWCALFELTRKVNSNFHFFLSLCLSLFLFPRLFWYSLSVAT